ncbi:DUF3078 domain-containing protein [Flavicella sediminum]|uniref:DUF3078 domain-containing protein n=1 Tax=Flavicella sediminum TaxID=2585141 RepID=UPI00112061C4|nr:DUF3078 domain-containing protein [Flavicella sediminum]
MKHIFFTFLIISFPVFMFASVEVDSISQKSQDVISVSQWALKKNIGLILTQTAFVNWNSGGDNSVAGIANAEVEYNYKSKGVFWDNRIRGRYGLNKKEGNGVRKTDDLLEITSNFGHRRSEKSSWYNSARFNFRTQFANGYKYKGTEKGDAISKFFSPAYIFLGVGSQYTNKKKKYKVYISPITNKTTLVFNQRLANSGAFGVEKAVYEDDVLVKEGRNSKIEFGTLLTGEWTKDIMDNVLMNNKLVLYSDYLNKYGNVDFDWELRFDLKVNKYVKANVGTHILYDDDVKDEETSSPKIQLKQLLGVGLTYSF